MIHMEKTTKLMIITGIIIFGWAVLITGIIEAPAFVWLIFAIITIIFYIAATGHTFRRRRDSLEDVMDDMETYMERRAESELGEGEKENSSEEQEDEDEYDFGDDIKVIKE